MKLVDILARELKVWPEGVAAIAQGATTNELYDSSFQLIKPVIRVSASDDCGRPGYQAGSEFITRAQWQAAVDALKAESCAHLWVGWSEIEACELCNKTRKIVVEWNGEGLPPVGVPVEWSEWQNGKFEKVTVLAYADGDAWIKPEWRPSLIVGNPAGFRPIKTAEQIVADERDKAVGDMFKIACAPEGTSMQGVMRLLYDAGYRKFEIVDN